MLTRRKFKINLEKRDPNLADWTAFFNINILTEIIQFKKTFYSTLMVWLIHLVMTKPTMTNGFIREFAPGYQTDIQVWALKKNTQTKRSRSVCACMCVCSRKASLQRVFPLWTWWAVVGVCANFCHRTVSEIWYKIFEWLQAEFKLIF